ncbi:MAG: lipoyl(octanoyl) transferase LipB [Gammaproteobacteria bacterium]|nr:lipoyl(octanoyl) transferase LipB [Gammaproteobacteria bacterium]
MSDLIVRYPGLSDYVPVWKAMQTFTEQRNPQTLDELWFVEHPSVFTLGRNADEKHLINPGDIPVIKTDRGGQVTYHGPGQLVAYLLVDIQRKDWGVRQLVTTLENTVIDLLAEDNISAVARRDAPGVYVDNAKIASLGLRIRKGKSYHGLSLNVDMDMEPFTRIHPCGLKEISITDTRTLGGPATVEQASEKLLLQFQSRLGNVTTEIRPFDPAVYKVA